LESPSQTLLRKITASYSSPLAKREKPDPLRDPADTPVVTSYLRSSAGKISIKAYNIPT
jgi:hypothetical protein